MYMYLRIPWHAYSYIRSTCISRNPILSVVVGYLKMLLSLRSAVYLTIGLYVIYLFLYQVFFLIVAIGIVYTIIDHAIRRPKVPRIQDRYVLVTGTSSGLGRHVVKYLDKVGCHVLACARSEKGEKELQSECSDRLRLVRLDIANPESIHQVVDQVKAILPKGQGQLEICFYPT